jgi:hypothetical protein
MIDPDELLEILVAALQDIPALVTLVGGEPANISAFVTDYPESTNWMAAVQQMRAPSILIRHDGTIIGDRSRHIAHQYCAYVMARGRAGVVFQAMREGVVTTGGQKMKLTQIDRSCHPPDFRGFFQRLLAIADQAVIGYYEVPIVLTERGVDN